MMDLNGGFPSLNKSIVAAWNVNRPAAGTANAVASGSSSTSTGTSTGIGSQRRAKRTISLNGNGNGSGSGAGTDSGAGTNTPPLPGPGSEPTTPGASALGVDGSGSTSTSTPNPQFSSLSIAAPEINSTPAPPRRKRPKTTATANVNDIAGKYAPPDLKLSSLGGLQSQIEQLNDIVVLPLLHPEIYAETGIPRCRGVLLHGVPGGGKTQLVMCLAGELGLPFINISAPSIVSGMSGESEKTLRDLFDEAKKIAPCVLFMDEVDAITPKRENAQREMERRIVAQLLTCMDDLARSKAPVLVIGATNRPDSLDPALRRAGRFDHEIEMGVPSLEGREEILRVLCSEFRLAPDVNFRTLAKMTPGYVGADLTSLASEAGIVAIKRIIREIVGELPPPSADGTSGVESMIVEEGSYGSTLPLSLREKPIFRFLMSHPAPLSPEQLQLLSLNLSDFTAALKVVQPAAKREGFATVPNVTWADIGALGSVRDELHRTVVAPIQYPEFYSSVGIDNASGVLLWGPPGCGKTLLAKAVANESGLNFISVKGPELLNKYVGESEKAVRQVFARASASAPCVIFFDELDALVPRRDGAQSEASARVVNTMLAELDGHHSRKAVYVIGATNRPDMIDPAMVRPGRLDKLLYVDLPAPGERLDIFKTHAKRTPVDPEAWGGIEEILLSDKCDGYSGADIAAFVKEAATIALLDAIKVAESNGGWQAQAQAQARHPEKGGMSVIVRLEHFAQAAEKTLPSVSKAQRAKFERMRNRFAGLPTRSKALHEDEPEVRAEPMEGPEHEPPIGVGDAREDEPMAL